MIRLLVASVVLSCPFLPDPHGEPTDPTSADMPCEVQEDCDQFGLPACIDGQCQDYVPVECDSQDDCEDGEVCGDTRTCSPLCSEDVECAPVQPWTCGDEQGYCVVPCSDSDDCVGGQVCGAQGLCWFPPA